MNELDHLAVQLTASLAAGEDWSSEYLKAPEQHAALIKNEAKWQVAMTRLFKKFGVDSANYINWYAYHGQVKMDYNVEVIVNNVPDDAWDKAFIAVSIDYVTEIAAAGAQAGEAIYNVPLGISSTSESIQKLSTQHVASLVGKKVEMDGSIIDNPDATVNINQTVRKSIAQSIKTSLAAGEDVQAATARLRKVISDPRRAALIARTESVNAYQAGLTQFAIDSGAVGKEWLDVSAQDICAEFAGEGPVPINFLYDGVYQGPTAHPGCRCGRRLIYPQEWKQLGKQQ